MQLLWFFIWRNMLCFKNTQPAQGQVWRASNEPGWYFKISFFPLYLNAASQGIYTLVSDLWIFVEKSQNHTPREKLFPGSPLLYSSETLNSFKTQHFILFLSSKTANQSLQYGVAKQIWFVPAWTLNNSTNQGSHSLLNGLVLFWGIMVEMSQKFKQIYVKLQGNRKMGFII